MAKFIGCLLNLCATSFYLFPVTLNGMPSYLNTKLLMAIIGVVVFIFNVSNANIYYGKVIKNFVSWFGLACCVSFATYISLVLNNTSDYTYVTYVISMLVWTSAAYLVIKMIEGVHGYVNVQLVLLYLMAMCALQCILAIAIDMNADVQQFVDKYYPDSEFFHEKKRMYGFGCGLDVAGGRFSAVLVMIAFLLFKDSKDTRWYQIALYITCFIIISIIGNMIGRTTTMGMILGISVIIYSLYKIGPYKTYFKTVVGLISAFVITTIILYNIDSKWQENLEFGFEGFFSLIEKGRWEVHSNDMLQEGFIFPDNVKTWLIGDGYFDEPGDTNPYYTGPSFYGYYMGTDSGYSRFIFYFGLIGLFAFSVFMIKTIMICADTFPKYKYMFFGILLLNFIIWIKVSTDIYVTMAPFISLSFVKRAY